MHYYDILLCQNCEWSILPIDKIKYHNYDYFHVIISYCINYDLTSMIFVIFIKVVEMVKWSSFIWKPNICMCLEHEQTFSAVALCMCETYQYIVYASA